MVLFLLNCLNTLGRYYLTIYIYKCFNCNFQTVDIYVFPHSFARLFWLLNICSKSWNKCEFNNFPSSRFLWLIKLFWGYMWILGFVFSISIKNSRILVAVALSCRSSEYYWHHKNIVFHVWMCNIFPFMFLIISFRGFLFFFFSVHNVDYLLLWLNLLLNSVFFSFFISFFFLNQKWNKVLPGGLVIKNLPASVWGVTLTLIQEVPICHEAI